MQKAKECLEIGDYDRAIRLYNAELDHHPQNFEARYGLGLAYYQKARAENGSAADAIRGWAKSVDELECALRIRSTPVLTQNLANACYHLAAAQDDQGHSEEAMRNLERALGYRPGHIQALHRLGSIQYQLREYDRARSTFQRVLETDPSFIPAYQNLGSTLWALGRLDEASAIWKAGLDLSPRDEFLRRWHSKAESKTAQ